MNGPPPSAPPVPTLTAQEVLAHAAATVVDLRSPSEFAEDHVPGARNVPLFDDLERALVGRLFHRESREAAFEAGRERVAARIGDLVAEVARLAGWTPPAVDLAEEVRRRTSAGIDAVEATWGSAHAEEVPPDPVVLHCWRGGLRSRSVVALLRDLGLERAVGLEGGYKRYRATVRAELEAWEAPPTFVLRGLTGVGKTLVLRALEAVAPGTTLDLEGLAGHRSSVLGRVGLEPVSQKAFESGVAERLRRGFARGYCVVEGESRKVGDVVQPPRVWEALRGGTAVLLRAPVERRVEVLLEDYLARAANRAELRGQLPFIEQRLGPVKWAGELVGLLDRGADDELVRVLLEHYYDPLYRHSERGVAYELELDASDPRRAAEAIRDWIERRAAGT